MEQDRTLIRSQLTTPRATAVAGILFSVLLIASLVLTRLYIPADPVDGDEWLAKDRTHIELALGVRRPVLCHVAQHNRDCNWQPATWAAANCSVPFGGGHWLLYFGRSPCPKTRIAAIQAIE